jgi:hypothetical protein
MEGVEQAILVFIPCTACSNSGTSRSSALKYVIMAAAVGCS